MADQKNNTGHGNSGDWNSGNRNSGDWNSGYWNSGYGNSGNRNSGNRNSGDGNSGNRNSGDRNSGDGNSGDWNSGDWNSGFFCTEEPKASFFDQPSTLSFEEARALIPHVELPVSCEWVSVDNMTDQEKTAAPSYKSTGGFLRVFHKKVQEVMPSVWTKLSLSVRKKFLALPNFDREKFKKCTGVDVHEDRELFPRETVVELQVAAVAPDDARVVIGGVKYRLVRV